MKLIIEDEEGRKTVVPFVREEISIGRQEGNTIRLTERNVSRKHARLVRKNGSVLIEDLGSFNGIRLNGDKIEGKSSVQEGDLIEIGDYDLAIETEAIDTATPAPERADGRAQTEPAGGGHAATPVSGRAPTLPANGPEAEAGAEPSESARHQATAVIRTDTLSEHTRDVRGLAAAERPKLVFLSGDDAGQASEIARSEWRVGRTAGDNDLAINHRSISRNHAKFVRGDDGSWRVLDLQSANGVRVNGEDYADAPLASGDTVELGHVKLRFVGPGESYRYVPDEERTPTPLARSSQLPGNRPLGLYLGVAGAALVVVGVGGWFLFSRGKEPPPALEPHRLPDSQLAVATPPAHPAPPVPSKAAPSPAAVPAAPPAAAAPEEPARPSRRQLLALVAEGKAALRDRDLAGAEEKLKAAQDAAPDDPAVARLEKEIESARKRETKREKHKAPPPAQVAEAAPAEPQVDKKARAKDLYQDGYALATSGNCAGAVSKLSKALGLDSSLADAHYVLGVCYARLSEPAKGAAQYEAFLRQRPNDPKAASVKQILHQYYSSQGGQ